MKLLKCLKKPHWIWWNLCQLCNNATPQNNGSRNEPEDFISGYENITFLRNFNQKGKENRSSIISYNSADKDHSKSSTAE